VKEVLIDENETLGTVKWFSRMKGWGFIEPDDGDGDVFVHYESIVGDGFRNLEKGDRVRFLIEDTPKGPKAIEVSSAEASLALWARSDIASPVAPSNGAVFLYIASLCGAKGG
jgi:CspA family cold shock protein